MFGFPIHTSFIDIPSLWEEVRNTDLHNVADESCQFVLATRVFSYPCYVCSVWVYIAALFPEY
jgi:hypothetical protein